MLDLVALLAAKPDHHRRVEEVGTAVEELDKGKVLVEFGDDEGQALAIVPCLRSELVLRYVSCAA